jgi:hypothetical protein
MRAEINQLLMDIIKKTITVVATVGLLALPFLALADEPMPVVGQKLMGSSTVKHYATDTVMTLGSAAVTVKTGSAYTSLAVSDDKLRVSVPEGEAFEIRQSSFLPLENNVGEAACRILATRENRLLINGPREAEVFVGASPCSTANYNQDSTSRLSVLSPAAGEKLSEGIDKQIFWTLEGDSLAAVRLRLSLDGGETYPITIADNIINNGYYNWDVPLVETTSRARIMIVGLNQGAVTTFSVTPEFSIEGTEPAERGNGSLSVNLYDYDPATETAESDSVDVGSGFLRSSAVPAGSCTPGIRLRLAGASTVYYCGVDGKRHAFPNRKVHDSWFDGFAGVVVFSAEEMAGVQLGANVTYRPGVRLVKLDTDPKVYAVAAGGILRWVETEAAAERLYGGDWNRKIDDVPDAFFADYTLGESIK